MEIFSSIKQAQIKFFTKGACKAMLSSFLIFEEQMKEGKIEAKSYSELAAKALSTRPKWKKVGENVFERKMGEKIQIKEEDTLADVTLSVILIEMNEFIMNDNKPEIILSIILNEFKKYFSTSKEIVELVIKRNKELQIARGTIAQQKIEKHDFDFSTLFDLKEKSEEKKKI